MTLKRSFATSACVCLVAALSACGDGGASSIPGVPVPAPAPAPTPTATATPAPAPTPEVHSAPTGLHVAATTPDSITWRWNAVEGAVAYAVQFSLDDVFNEADRPVIRIETMFRLDGLEPGTRVHVRVAATSGTGDNLTLSPWTESVAGTSSLGTGPTPAPPSPNARTVIGFATPAHATLDEGSRMHAVVAVSGEMLRSPLRLSVKSRAPADQLLVPEEIEIGAGQHGSIAIVAVADRIRETTASYSVTLEPPPEGLPRGVAFADGGTIFWATVDDGPQDAECSRLRLDVAVEDVDQQRNFSTARLVLEGPERVGLRIIEPYWNDRLAQREEPPELPIDLRDVPPITLAIPNELSWQALGGGHRQRIKISWYWDLHLAGVSPGCEPVSLRCPARQGCPS